MVLTGYFVLVWNYTFKAIYKVNIFVDMDEEQYSEELTDLLTRLNKGHTWGANRVLNLSDAEREIFMAAANEASKIRKKEFADLIKEKD